MSLPHDIGSTVPQYINGSLVDEFLPLSFSRTLGYWIICEKLTGIQLFDEQEGCTKDEKYTVSLWVSRIDRSDRRLKLRIADNLYAVEVYDGGLRYKDIKTKVIEDEERGFILYVKDAHPLRPGIPPNEETRDQSI